MKKKRKTLAQMFSPEFCGIYQNTNFEECQQKAAMTNRFYGGVPL